MVSFKAVMVYLLLVPVFLAVGTSAAGCPAGTCPTTITTSSLVLPAGFVILSDAPLCPGQADCNTAVNCTGSRLGGCSSSQLTPTCPTGSAAACVAGGPSCPGPNCGAGNALCINSAAATCAGAPTCGAATCGSDTATCRKSGTSVTCPGCPAAIPRAVCPRGVAVTTATVRVSACCCSITNGGGSNSFCASVVTVTIGSSTVTTANTCTAAGGTCAP